MDNPTKEIAKHILTLLNTAHIQADDQSVANLQAVKGWLGAIAEGKLLVSPVSECATPGAA